MGGGSWKYRMDKRGNSREPFDKVSMVCMASSTGRKKDYDEVDGGLWRTHSRCRG